MPSQELVEAERIERRRRIEAQFRVIDDAVRSIRAQRPDNPYSLTDVLEELLDLETEVLNALD